MDGVSGFQFWIIILVIQLEILGMQCKSELHRVHEDILLPYTTYPGPRHRHRYVRECQPVKYANTTHEEPKSHRSKSFPDDYRVVDPKYFVKELGEYWDKKTVFGHHFVINDPGRTVSVLEPLRAQGCRDSVKATVDESAKQKTCLLAVNAGFFNVTSGACIGNVVSDGREAMNSGGVQNAHFGVKQDGSLFFGYIGEDVDLEEEFQQLVGGVIWLVRNGENYISISEKAECPDAQSTGQLQDFINVISSRISVGNDDQGRLVIVAIDGRTYERGVDLKEFADLLISLGVKNAINLDGGGSVTAVLNGSLINYPGDTCEEHNFTYSCEREVSTIICIHDLECDPADCSGHGDCLHGKCHCHDYWEGPHCGDLKCGSKNCSQHGSCQPWGCDCQPGWTGSDCMDPCPKGSFGKNCSQICFCQHSGASCHPTDGHCLCPAGYQGYYCDQECAYGTYGEDCQAVCECDDTCACDPVSGNCTIRGRYPNLWQEGNCFGDFKIINKTLIVITEGEMNSWIVTVIILCTISSLSLILNIVLIWLCLKSRSDSKVLRTGNSGKTQKMYSARVSSQRVPRSDTYSTSSESDESSIDVQSTSFIHKAESEAADFSFFTSNGAKSEPL